MLNKKEPLLIIAIKTLLAVIIFAGVGTIIFAGGWLVRKSQIEKVEISKTEAIRIASQTEEVREFLKLYPDANVTAHFGPPLSMRAQSDWTVSYTPSNGKDENLNRLVTYLNIILDKFGNIRQINPNLEIMKDEKRCDSNRQCYAINYPDKIDCVNFIYIWKIQKDLNTQPLFHCTGSAVCHSDIPCRCVNDSCEVIKYESVEGISDWKTYRDEKYAIEFKYPKDFPFFQQPELLVNKIDPDGLSTKICTEGKSGNTSIKKVTAGKNTFCSYVTEDGAAGSTYTDYKYSVVEGGGDYAVHFVIKYTNCGVYSDETEQKYIECEEFKNKTAPEVINQILSTFKFTGK